MFYLSNFFLNIKNHPFWGGLFAMTSIFVLACAINFTSIEESVFATNSSYSTGPYFHALISGQENHKRISRKLTELPGVNRVEILGEAEIQDQVSKVLSNLDLGMEMEEMNLNYAGLKVILDKSLQERSQNLIRDYLVRLVGSSKLTLGAVKAISKAEELKNQVFTQFKEWGITVVSIACLVIWSLISIVFSSKVQQSSYIIEKFQRRNKVGLKVMLTGMATLLSFCFAISFSLGSVNTYGALIGVALVALLSIVQLRNLQWHE
ncbi:SPFH domain-containing protein [Halobacteriovorax marinus]|nr:hypothetical protein [Halobacteriovorax marinus]